MEVEKKVSSLIEMCLKNDASYRDDTGKCSLTSMFYKAIGSDKEILACPNRDYNGTCYFGKSSPSQERQLTQDQINELTQMVLDAQKE